MTTRQLVPALLAPLILWRIYSRIRRNIGRQPFRPKRLVSGMIFFGIIILLIGLSAWRTPSAVAALGGGLLLAVPLGLLALKLTKFEALPEGEFYTPNTTLGLAVTCLLVGRIAYRIALLFGDTPSDASAAKMYQSPLTLFVFGITAGYYVSYYLGMYIHGRKEIAAHRSAA